MTNRIVTKFLDISARTDKWIAKASSYMYNFRDGHFQFPYAANDPEMMIESLKKTPFVTFDTTKQCLETNSPFMKVKQNYLQIEDGFWIIDSQVHWKVKVKVIALIDEIPSDYYFLTYTRTTESIEVLLENGEHTYQSFNQSWTLYKSTTALNAFFKKNCKSNSTFFVFNKEWLEKHCFTLPDIIPMAALEILNAGNAYKSYIYNAQEITEKCNIIHNLMDNIALSDIDVPLVKSESYAIVIDFFKNISLAYSPGVAKEKIHKDDIYKMEQIEKLLKETLTTGFLGIDKISKEYGVSPSKLKADFKTVFNESIFQYYQHKQLELSVALLRQNMNIGEVAQILGYENKSKFSSKFKSTFGVLPSKYY